MKNYDIIEGRDLIELINNVNESINNGFIPIGGVVLINDVSEFIYKQTMFNPNVKIQRVNICQGRSRLIY